MGVQLSRALASQGAKVVLLARREDATQKGSGKDIEKDFGVEALPLRCDATSTEDVDQVVATSLRRFGRIDILVNCAGLSHLGNAEDIKDEDFLEIRSRPLWHLPLRKSGVKEGNDSRQVWAYHQYFFYVWIGKVTRLLIAPYPGAAKGGTINLTRALKTDPEWGKHGITVNTIAPGYFWTAMTQSTLETEQFAEYAEALFR